MTVAGMPHSKVYAEQPQTPCPEKRTIMLHHKTEVKQNEDGSTVLDVYLTGNPVELAAFAHGKVHGGFVKSTLPTGEPNPDELHIALKLQSAELPAHSKENVEKLEAKARGEEKPKKAK